MPLHRRLPKRGFTNIFRKRYAVISLERLGALGESRITPELLLDRGVISHVHDGVKVLSDGELKVPLTVVAHAFSRSAREKIERAGGKVEVLA
jgi:large subunit ribosomal protein L15